MSEFRAWNAIDIGGRIEELSDSDLDWLIWELTEVHTSAPQYNATGFLEDILEALTNEFERRNKANLFLETIKWDF